MRLDALRSAPVDARAVAALEADLRSAPDAALCRINPLRFAERHGVPEQAAIDVLLHAARQGVLDLSWNLLCQGCGCVLDAAVHLRAMKDGSFPCGLCAIRVTPSLDELVEVSFTVSPSVRAIAAHKPDELPFWEYVRQLYFSPSLELPVGDDWDAMLRRIVIAEAEVPAGATRVIEVEKADRFLIVFDPVHHLAGFLDVQGPPAEDVQTVRVVFTPNGATPQSQQLRPGPLRLTVENHLTDRALVGVFHPSDEFHHGLQRKPFLTGKQLLTNQTFRELFRSETLDADQRLKIANLTVVFTDLKGSTALYDKVGDLAAYDLVKSHFRVLGEVVRNSGGAVVKTIGDAVMATFPTPGRGLGAAFSMREAMDELNVRRGSDPESLTLKIGMHSGPCLAVTLNERLDYFGQAVNIAARVQGLADSRSIFATAPVVQDEAAAALLRSRSVVPQRRLAQLKGVPGEVEVYELD